MSDERAITKNNFSLEHEGEPSLIDIYSRILKASKMGKGVRLSWIECMQFEADTAIAGAVEANTNG